MKRAYLILIDLYNADDIEILHQQSAFAVTYYNNKIIFKLEDVKDFMFKFATELDKMIKDE